MLNTSFVMEQNMLSKFKSFVLKELLPSLEGEKLIQDLKFSEVDSNDKEVEAKTFSLQFVALEQDLELVESRVLTPCLSKVFEKFGQSVLFFSTKMNIIAWHNG